jgi:sugar lactone lactonase YvrE
VHARWDGICEATKGTQSATRGCGALSLQMSTQVLATHTHAITSPTFGPSGDLFTISTSGDIYRYVGSLEYENDLQVESWGDSSGQPFGLVFGAATPNNPSGAAFICDAAHQALFKITRTEGEDGVPRQQIEPYVREYEQAQFLGPNSLCLARSTGTLYFTDSGPFGETSLQNPRGSVFAISSSPQLLIPLCLHTLAHPCGVALSPDEKNIYVAETAMNRVLRFSQHPPGVFHCSVFHQLSGRFGPTALAVRENGDLFVAHFDFADNAENGKILVLDCEGEVSYSIMVPGPEVTGLCLTPNQSNLLITERSTTSIYRHPLNA